MTSREFCYWLQGYFEINHEGQAVSMNAQQIECVRRHLAMVFRHEIDPSYKDQKALNQLHKGDSDKDVVVRC